ncbi:MAG: ABC transporter substrate-binding protein [Epulopiscium sp. Nuni2H_MBin003]|nr:MAG: ABC transporter substrate-binding protein [Epulopiscium sp. Nuni2H_MBin003]
MTKLAKKLIAVGLLGGLMITTFTGCSSSSSSDSKTVTIWAQGSDNTKMQLEAQAERFNEIQDEYEAKVEFIITGTGTQGVNERVLAAYKAGQTDTMYDLIEIDDGKISGLLAQDAEDLFLEIDKSQLSNHINCRYEPSDSAEYMVPYRGTTVLLAYNSNTVPNPPSTMDELYQWIKDNPGRFAYNPPNSGGAGASFVVATVYNQMEESALTSSDESNKQYWDAGFEILADLHPYMYQSSGKVVYPNKNQGTMDILASREIDMTPVWADMFISQQGLGTMPSEMKVTQIDPPLTGNLVGFSIPSIGSNSEGALAFINYMLSAEAQNIALESMAALPVIDFGLLDPEAIKSIETLDVKEFRNSSLGTLQTELYDKWDMDIAPLN